MDYLSDKAVNSVKQGESYQPNQSQKQKETQSANENTKIINGKTYDRIGNTTRWKVRN